MSQPWESWWYRGDYTDRQTNHRIDEVEAQNSRPAQATSNQVALQEIHRTGLASSTEAVDRLAELLTGPGPPGKRRLLTPPASAPERPAGHA